MHHQISENAVPHSTARTRSYPVFMRDAVTKQALHHTYHVATQTKEAEGDEEMNEKGGCCYMWG